MVAKVKALLSDNHSEDYLFPSMSAAHVSLYRSIMKGTALFGGTQLVSVLANVLRGKMVAVLLMSAGLGISSLYMSTMMPLQQFFSMGMPIAVVSAIAAASVASDEGRNEVAARITAFRRTLLVLALAGVAFMVLMAPLLSSFTFDNGEHTMAYICLSAALFFLIMESGETAILQARRSMKKVAMRSVVNALSSLCLGVPFYWWLGTDGIVPAIIVSTGSVWCYSRWQTHKMRLSAKGQSWQTTWTLSRGIMTLGFFMMLAALLGNVTNYFINTSIRHFGTLSDVGLYQASTSITSQYVGLVFAAMATDYYPRLSSVTGCLEDVKRLVHQELELVLLIVTPLVLLLIVTAPLLIRILLTDEFLPLTGVVRLTGLSIICKAAYFPLDYVSMAYGRKRFFFWMEGVWVNIKAFVIVVSFYYAMGIEGIGWAMLVSGLIDVVVSTVMTRWVFHISTWRLQVRYFLPLLLGAGLCAALSFCQSPLVEWGGMIAVALAEGGICLWLLARRVNLLDWLRSYRKK